MTANTYLNVYLNLSNKIQREKALEDYESILEQQEEAFETEQEAEAAQYNFAFFMILFITVFTGGYYAYGKIREKFFPASSSVSDYIAKKWRYWDQEVHKRTKCLCWCFIVLSFW